MFESVEEYNIPYIPPIMLNAYILYFTNTPKNPKLSRISFDQSVIQRLAAEHNYDDHKTMKLYSAGLCNFMGEREEIVSCLLTANKTLDGDHG